MSVFNIQLLFLFPPTNSGFGVEQVVYGTSRRYDKSDNYFQLPSNDWKSVGIKQIFSHPEYRGAGYRPNDIAIIELEKPITETNDTMVRTIGFEADFSEKCNTSVTMYGFGWSQFYRDPLQTMRTLVQNGCPNWNVTSSSSFIRDVQEKDFIVTKADNKTACYVSIVAMS